MRVPFGKYGPLIIGAIVALVLVVSVSVPLLATAKPSFLGNYASLKRSYSTLQTSAHAGLACDACHAGKAGAAAYKAALIGDFYRDMLGRQKAPVFVKLATPINAACMKCHRYDWSDDAGRTLKVPHPAHLRVIEEKRDCVTCHRWVGHEEDYMQKHKTMRFSSVCAAYPCHVGTKAKSDCQTCHHALQTGTGDKSWKATHPSVVRSAGPNSCLETCHSASQCRQCHTTGKTPDFGAAATPDGVRAIEANHVKSDWLEQHGSFALADESKCFQCHVSVGECEDCHAKRPAFHGLKSTWIGRHKDLSKDRKRCLACHQEEFCDNCHKQFKEMR